MGRDCAAKFWRGPKVLSIALRRKARPRLRLTSPWRKSNTTYTMAKRKQQIDPEELPDASDKGKLKPTDESDSDEVCDAGYLLCACS